MPLSFPAHATHVQTVLRPPEGATVLAKSEQDDCHAFRWRDRAWGVQFHPESVSYTHLDVYKRQASASGKVANWPMASRRVSKS